ncbi:hypothetical protein N7456_001606 [Penicillium angulare]|uniref:CheY-like superfamily n=1 Tax=Penicillium angulare TaxID=116970 RepID=A0A9W9KPG3_9EURO|nr:hypothetical protein N7456_001606 [Penicillium angulare]
MNRTGSLAFHLPPCDAERKRIQELSRYYCTLDRPSTDSISPDDPEKESLPAKEDLKGDEQPTAAILSPDITLTALSQLGVLRLGCNRSFVSIIDGDNQHIIAEATSSVSIRNVDQHLPGDGIYLGARTLDLIWGVCPHTIGLFTGQDLSRVIDTDNVTANRTRYIIRDFTKEDCFKDRPYVCEWPHMRFYAEVPLYSPSGYVLGSFCVVDDKPREEFGDADVNVLQEISDAIALHLENTRVVHYHRRAERLVKGLTTFVKDHADFDPREISSNHRLESSTRAANAGELSNVGIGNASSPLISSPETHNTSGLPPRSCSTSPSEEPSPLFFSGPPSGTTTDLSSINSNLSDRQAPTPGEEKSLDEVLRSGSVSNNPMPQNTSMVSLTDSIPLSDRIERIFCRASALLKQSMDLDGVVFLDASRTNPSYLPTGEEDGWEPLPKSASSTFPSAPLPSPLGPLSNATHEPNMPCEILGSSLKRSQMEDMDPNRKLSISEQLLDTLVTHFPQGQVFDLADLNSSREYWAQKGVDCSTESCADNVEAIPMDLSKMLPGAKSVLFFPLWNYHQSRWMAGTLVWTRDNHRSLGLEELHYFKVFGDSIVSEISRIHWSTTEKSKFDFISSVSHELRSPLHGILASAELLQATALLPSQEDMVQMIESSGLTLLDTTDHLLDFCKINNLTQTKKARKKRSQESSGLISEFNLDQLIEEVSNILYTGHKIQDLTSGDTNIISLKGAGTDSDSSEMSVVVRIEQSHHWNIRSQPGAWRRIVMNLLGNSIKWTKKGFVEVSLSRTKCQPDSQSFFAHLTVTDTGSGIAPDFLRHKLFSPFTQEDSLAEGVGLGLSIVRLLVASLGGHVNVKSEVGIGTQVDVHIPVQGVSHTAEPNLQDPHSIMLGDGLSEPRRHACLVAFNGYPKLAETPTGMLTAEAKRKLSIQSTFADILMSRFGWGVSLVESLDKVQGDVAVIEEETLWTAIENRHSLEPVAQKFGVKSFIVLGSKISILQDAVGSNFVRVSQPFGPRKIQQAVRMVQQFLESNEQNQIIHTPVDLEAPEQPPSSPDSAETVKAEAEDRDTTPKTSIEVAVSSTLPVISPVSLTPEIPTLHVLVVDDNNINLKIMATFMRKIGCTYDTASNGLIALEKYMASDKRYDFVLMDISMPVMDGLVSTSKIRQYEKDKGLTPSCIMAVTGVASDSMHQQALAAGINDYLIKPLSLKELQRLMGIS